MLRSLFNLVNPLDRFLVEYITPYPVHCIGGITDNRTAAQLFGNLLNIPRLWIVLVN